jgi:hypothetical protein
MSSQADLNRKRNEYMEMLDLQDELNDYNLQSNKNYLLTGSLPPSAQVLDTRTNAEKLADIEKLKIETAQNLRPIAEPNLAFSIVNAVINNPLNVDNSLFRFLAQRAESIAEQMKRVMPYGIAGDQNDVERIVEFIKNMYSEQQGKFQSTKSYLNSTQTTQTNSRILSGNDIDAVINGFNDIVKNISLILSSSNNNILQKSVNTLRSLGTDLMNLKTVLPSNNQLEILINDINNSYQTYGEPKQNNYTQNDLKAFFDIIEKLPKYNEIMALIGKVRQYIKNGNYSLADDGILRMTKLLSVVNDNKAFNVLNKFKNIKDGLAVQEKQNMISTNNSIQQQIRQEKDFEKIQPVRVVNFDDFKGSNQSINNSISSSQSINNNSPVFTRNPTTTSQPSTQPTTTTTTQSSSTPSSSRPVNPLAGLIRNQERQERLDRASDERIRLEREAMPTLSPLEKLRAKINDMNVRELDELGEKIGKPVNHIQGAYKKKISIIQYILSDIDNFNKYSLDVDNQILGLGLRRRVGRPRGSGIVKEKPVKIPNFVGFGINEINQKQLQKGIVKIRRNTKTNYNDMPSKHVSPRLQGILKTIVGGGVPNFNDLSQLDDDEKDYLSKLVNRSSLEDKLSVPAPSKDQIDKDIHQFEVMKGQIMSGNDNQDLVKKFKLLILKLSKRGMLPKNDVDEVIEALLTLGY